MKTIRILSALAATLLLARLAGACPVASVTTADVVVQPSPVVAVQSFTAQNFAVQSFAVPDVAVLSPAPVVTSSVIVSPAVVTPSVVIPSVIAPAVVVPSVVVTEVVHRHVRPFGRVEVTRTRVRSR